MRRTATTAPTRKRSRSASIRQGCRELLSLRHLLPVGRAAPRRRGDDRRRERLRLLAAACRDRVETCRSVLGGRAGAPGLLDALSRRLHLPLSATGLEAAEAR